LIFAVLSDKIAMMKKNFWEKLSAPGGPASGGNKPIMVIAPMSGVTDEAFRLMFLKYGKPDIFWTEFISASALVSEKGREYCLNVLKFSPKERPIIAQVFGSNPTQMENACKFVESLGFDGIDINMGCPDRNIEKQGAGSDLIKNPALAKKIIQSAKKGAKNIPISVKTRIGYSKNEINKWIPAILEENVSALTIHFRTRNELYLPPAHWDLAKQVVALKNKISPKTLIIGNGDVKTLEQAYKLVEKTGVDGVMIGRAVLGNPWFFSKKIPTLKQKLKAIVEHANLLSKDKHWDSIKKHFHAYAKGFRGASNLREKLMKVKNAGETKKVIDEFLKNVV
jgi:nifR3 family TIM-barrel protein